MTHNNPKPGMDAYEFILKNIDSVPHLEALMLLWNKQPAGCTCEELASRLYISTEKVTDLLHDLVRLRLISASHTAPPVYAYFPQSEEQDEIMRLVDAAYRHDLIRISTMIHSKASSPIREFARAFRLKRSGIKWRHRFTSSPR